MPLYFVEAASAGSGVAHLISCLHCEGERGALHARPPRRYSDLPEVGAGLARLHPDQLHVPAVGAGVAGFPLINSMYLQ